MSDILFIKTSSLGDVIHHMPAVSDARRHLPQARIGWVVEEAFAPLVRLNCAVDTVIPVASRRWRRLPFRADTWREIGAFRRAMRAQSHETVIDAQGLLRSALIARFARGRLHGYDSASVRERAASWFYDVHHNVDRTLHAIARNRMLTGQVLGYAPDGPLDFGLDRATLSSGAPAREVVLLHATARPEKEWPVADWIELARVLAAGGHSLVLPWGNEAERRRSQTIAAAVPNAKVPDLQPLDDVARMIARAAFVVGVDTGLLHLAAALGVPLVAIFLGTEPGQYGPLGAGKIEVVGTLREMPSLDDVRAAVERVAR
ncbi:MAG: lipopolysaccharide heptosyltransferase I [Alphaproteobacteria bacterium]|nr:MAG: lipopolysaccharide heptosyltransferase I [Alphaproteobacteria bacterium]